MNWLIKNRMNIYWVGLVLYVVSFNILFYTSNNIIITTLESIANVVILLAVIGFLLHGRKRKSDKLAREQKREARKNSKN